MKKIILTILLTILTTISLGVTTAYATVPEIPQPHTLPGPSSEEATKALTEGVLPKFAVFLTGSVSAIALLFLIIAGVKFATVYGKEEDVEKAKNQVIFALIGLFIALMAYTIVRIIVNFEYEGATTPAPAAQPAAKNGEAVFSSPPAETA